MEEFDMMKNRCLRCLSALLSLAIALSLLTRVLYAESDPSECYSVTDGLEFDVTATITSSWGNYANLEFFITNTGNETIHNWHLTFSFPYHIGGMWNAEVFETDDNGTYTVKNTGWNQDIQSGNTINFGMTVSSLDGQAIDSLPSLYLLNTKEIVIDSAYFELNYQEYSNWGSGFNGGLILSNNSLGSIEDWKLSFSSNREITEIAGADLTICDGTYTIANNGSDQNLLPNASINLTINGSGQNANSALMISDATMFSIGCAYGLSEDENNNGIVDYIDFIHSKNTDPGGSPTPTITPSPTPDPHLDSDHDGLPDVYEIEIGLDPYSRDPDGDGIDDSMELVMGLDPFSSDSDEDGIPDSEEDVDSDGLSLTEELQIGTNPWLDDSDDDGLLDGEEIRVYGTAPLNNDTDGDSINDGDEVKLGLDPTLPDSDGDGVADGQERILQTRHESIYNVERPVLKEVEVNLEGSKCLDSSMTIRDVYGIDTYSSELFGLVGVPIEIVYEGEFDGATLIFHYDETQLSANSLNLDDSQYNETTSEDDLGILWFDEESGYYIDCDAIVDKDNHTVSCQTTHFSTYMLYDKSAWEFRWKYELNGVGIPEATNLDEHGNSRGIDYFIMFQYDASVTDEQKQAQHDFIYSIIDNLGSNDRVQFLCQADNWLIGPYDRDIGFYPISDKQELKNIYDYLLWRGEMNANSWCSFADHCCDTDVGWVYMMTRTRFKNIGDTGNEVVTICLGNSIVYGSNSHYYKHSTLSGAYISRASDFVVVLPGGHIRSPKARDIEKWGGAIIEWDKVDDPYAEYCNLYSMKQGTDNDEGVGDGLWDWFEETGMVGTNGRFYYTDPDKIDTDEDGLTDFEEMGEATKLSVNSDGVVILGGKRITSSDYRYQSLTSYGIGTWYAFRISSHPRKVDTDGDFYSDLIDPHPKVSDLRIIGLEGDYNPKESSFHYIQVHGHPGCGSPDPSIGGNQDWFGKKGWNLEPDDEFISDSGCGLIAFSDFVLYQFTDIREIDFEQYYNHVHETMELLTFYRTAGGYFYGGMCTTIDLMYLAEGKLKHAYPVYANSNQPKHLLTYLERMIEDGKPIMTSICLNSEVFYFYELSSRADAGYRHTLGDSNWHLYESSYTGGHYFTITGMVYDNISGETYLRVANGGKEEYILYSEYLDTIEKYRAIPSLGSGADLGNLIICY